MTYDFYASTTDRCRRRHYVLGWSSSSVRPCASRRRVLLWVCPSGI